MTTAAMIALIVSIDGSKVASEAGMSMTIGAAISLFPQALRCGGEVGLAQPERFDVLAQGVDRVVDPKHDAGQHVDISAQAAQSARICSDWRERYSSEGSAMPSQYRWVLANLQLIFQANPLSFQAKGTNGDGMGQ